MTITSPLKKSIRAVLNSLTRLKTAEIVYTDRFSGKRKSVIADQLIFNNNDYLAYVNSIDYYLPFNRIEEIKSDDSLLWSRKVFEKENKLKVINHMIDGLKKNGLFTAFMLTIYSRVMNVIRSKQQKKLLILHCVKTVKFQHLIFIMEDTVLWRTQLNHCFFLS
ncbi:MAG: hypothetical protein NTW67_02460 [Candidatus Woesearchaeota archaeon]|nr:hypothetical protein [Candidatus Woesearchaeota archaeon]